jgi:CelD/BcsL family acetyltransferase involved in cellulose biosynthesis
MPVRWATGQAAFEVDWTALAHRDPEGTIFHTPSFLRLYREELAPDSTAVAVVHQGGDAVAVASFHIGEGSATFLGGFDVTDYMGPVGIPAWRDVSAKEVMAALAAREDWEVADLRGLVAEGAWLPALETGARDAGLRTEIGEDGVSPFLPLPGSFEEYVAGLPGKRRHEIRRKDRRLREAFPDAAVIAASAGTMADDLDRFFELHRASRGAKGRFMGPGMERFFRRLASELAADGTFRLAFLEAGGRRVAAAVGFADRDRFLLYNSAYDHDLSRLAPGMVLTAELIRGSIEQGCRAFDFLKGDLDYKYRFGARRRPVARLLLRR